MLKIGVDSTSWDECNSENGEVERNLLTYLNLFQIRNFNFFFYLHEIWLVKETYGKLGRRSEIWLRSIGIKNCKK